MPNVRPITDLKNYDSLLENVSAGSPVYLTKNGRGAYSIRDIKDEEEFEKAEAMIKLLCELNTGLHSVEKEGWLTEEEVKNNLKNRRLKYK
ncbi:MAG: prevent-host-death protein [Candidatus Riflebacteria bacterium]|nr:prevent-host-death protein [Candidatus Riflebacteria bacterium]